MIEMAIAYAHEHFEKCNIKRKYTGESYIVHPIRVMLLVKEYGSTDEMRIAAILHDSIEDCETVHILDIVDKFGIHVARLVDQLTDISRKENGNRDARKKIDLDHTAKSCPAAKTIKLADLIDNTRDIVNRDKDFAKIYLKEKENLLAVLQDASSLQLLKTAYTILEEAKKRLEVSE